MQYPQRNKYLQTTIQTATPAQLLIMLYDGAIRNCRQASAAIKENRNADANEFLIKAQNIVKEFMITLDQSNPISESLMSLYEYFNERLLEANLKKSTEPVDEVLGHLVELKETWIQAAKQYNQIAGQAGGSQFAATHTTVV